MPTDQELFEEGLGNVTWWGFSPATNLLGPQSGCKNILVLGAGDGRHILQSAAELESGQEAHFFVFEQNLLLYARQMLFMALLEEAVVVSSGSSHKDQVLEHAEAWLEVFGNLTLKPTTAERVTKVAAKIRAKVVAHQNSKLDTVEDKDHDNFLPYVDLSKLKSKELDALEGILKAWETEMDSVPATDMNKFWEFRLRQLFMDRYDVKDGIFEMDYQLRLIDRGGAKISHKEYCGWRKTGLAYPRTEEQVAAKPMSYSQKEEAMEDEEEEVSQACPNLTLLSCLAVKDNKAKKTELRKGYWGDVVSGPFIAFGFEYSTDIQITRTKVERFSQVRALAAIKAIIAALKARQDRPKITFLSVSSAEKDLLDRKKFAQLFDVAFVGCSVTHLLEKGFEDNFKEQAIVYVETPLYLLHIAKEVQAKFKEHLAQMCGTRRLQIPPELQSYDPNATAVVKVMVQQ